ncbi:MAG: hypothetical protein JWN15_1643 [Firmicutes bacterium]|nr:hypothetical protein [Bacillota bacterium]
MLRQRPVWWLIGGAVVVVGLLVASRAATNRPAPRPAQVAPVDAQLGPRPKVKGPDSAPAKVVEFADFQ